MSKVDYLTEDNLNPRDQLYVCISFLTDKLTTQEEEEVEKGAVPRQLKTLTGIKIRGSFATYEQASEHAKKLQGVDPAFNVFVGEVGKWLPFDPNPDSEYVKDSEYANEQLNNMMKSYMENQEKAKIYHEQRKNEQIRQNIVDNLKTSNNNLIETREQLEKAKRRNKTDKVASLENSLKSIEEQIKKMEDKRKELDEKIDETMQQIKTTSSSKNELQLIDESKLS